MGPANLESRVLRFPWAALAGGGALALALVRVAEASTRPAYLEPGRGGTTFDGTLLLLVLFVPYALALLSWRRGHRRPRTVTVLLAGSALHLAFLLAPPWGSQDLFQYLFYGKVAAVHGANPYLVEPVRFASDPWFPFITWTTQTTVYGPAWTMATEGVVRLTGSSLLTAYFGIKALVFALDLAVMVLIVAVGRRDVPAEGRDRAGGFGLLAWVLNPMVLVTVPVEAHADLAIGAAFVGAVLARRRGRPGLATLLLAVAALVKPYAAVGLLFHLVLLLRERGTRSAMAHAAGSAAIAVALYAPYYGGPDIFGGAAEVAGRFGTSLAGTVFRLIAGSGPGVPEDPEVIGSVILVAGAVLVVAVLAWLGWRLREEAGLWSAVTLGLAAYLLATPWFFFWHLLPLVALACALPDQRTSPAVLTASASTLVAFRLPRYQLGLAFQALARYVPPLAVYGRTTRWLEPRQEHPDAAPVAPPTARR